MYLSMIKKAIIPIDISRSHGCPCQGEYNNNSVAKSRETPQNKLVMEILMTYIEMASETWNITPAIR
jgi:hypothetical protein